MSEKSLPHVTSSMGTFCNQNGSIAETKVDQIEKIKRSLNCKNMSDKNKGNMSNSYISLAH